MKRGIFIGRFQPFHLGHYGVIKKMEKAPDLDEIIIGIGSAQCGNTTYNPFTFQEREKMVKESFPELAKPSYIIKINDINDYPNWISHVESLCPQFNVVYAGSEIVKRLFSEKNYEVRGFDESKRLFSATEIRAMMVRGESWQNFIPAGTIKVVKEIGGVTRVRKLMSEFINPGVTVDVIVNYKDKGVVLIKRKYEPFKDYWAIPGGFLDAGRETLEDAAVRELREETSLLVKKDDLKLMRVSSTPGRDPRGPTVSTIYYTNKVEGTLHAADDAKEIDVFKVLPEKMAFDHANILNEYYTRFYCKEI